MMMAAAFAAAITVMVCGACISSAAETTVTDGGLAWYYSFSGSQMGGVASSPVTDDSGVYIPAGNKLYKFDKATGKLLKTVGLSGSIGYNKLPPTIGGSHIFVALNNGVVDIIDKDTMMLEKTVTYDASYSGSQSLTPVAYDSDTGSIYLGSWTGGNRDRSGGGVFARVDISNDYKVTVLKNSDAGFYWSGACVDGDYVIFGSDSDGHDSGTSASGDATLYLYDKTRGTLTETLLSGSGSICSTPVEHDGSYYFTSKNKSLYKADVTGSAAEGTLKISTVKVSALMGESTCTPVITEENGKPYLYVASLSGKEGVIEKLNLNNTPVSVVSRSSTPADTKTITVDKNTGKVYATYNSPPGGICVFRDNLSAGDYFIPDSSMQEYCISAIAMDDDGTMYYANDGNHLMAVKDRDSAAEMRRASLGLPASVSAGIGSKYNSIKANWKAASGASGYYVKYKKSTASSWSGYKDAGSRLYYEKTGLSAGAKYYFRVYPYVQVGGEKYIMNATECYRTSSGAYTLKKTSISKVSKASSKYVKLKWKNINGESGYQIARSKYRSKSFTVVKTVSAKYSSAKIKTTKGKTYYYKVRAYRTVNGKKVPGPWSAVKSYKLK